jgi:hypothetical protein
VTDAEKERLKEASDEASKFDGKTYGAVIAMELGEGVIALLDRIEALEADNAAMVSALHVGDAKHEALAKAATYASAELRHALSYRKPDGCIDTNLVSRAVVTLETATTPNRPEVKP